MPWRPPVYKLCGVLSAGVLIAGAAFPWTRRNPNLPPESPVPFMIIPQATPGIQLLGGFDVFLLIAAAMIASSVLLEARPGAQAVLTLVLGGLIWLILAQYLLSYDAFIGLNDAWVPGSGWYLAVVGGGLALVTGSLGVALFSAVPWSQPIDQ